MRNTNTFRDATENIQKQRIRNHDFQAMDQQDKKCPRNAKQYKKFKKIIFEFISCLPLTVGHGPGLECGFYTQ